MSSTSDKWKLFAGISAGVVAVGLGWFFWRSRQQCKKTQSLDIIEATTIPFADQKPGTSGLRKKVTVFQQKNYVENFIQSIFNCLPQNELRGCALVLSGDGRYYNDVVIETVLRMAAANGVGKVILGQNGLMSTPCVSAVIRSFKAYGAIILTASHNPGGPKADFGIKYNCANGGPAPESLTNKIFETSKKIDKYFIAREIPVYDKATVGTSEYGPMTIEVMDAPKFYSSFLKTIFDFPALRKFAKRKDFSLIYDGLHGVGGPFASEIFVNELGFPSRSMIACDPLADFGGHHPDPNRTYAASLCRRMGLPSTSTHDEKETDSKEAKTEDTTTTIKKKKMLSSESEETPKQSMPVLQTTAATDTKEQQQTSSSIPEFGAATDGDADRNMILGKEFFVTPSDSVAIIAAYAQLCIPYFKTVGVTGVARSMPTSAALDHVSEQLHFKCYEVPTGWKYFGNLMDAKLANICGEESFGTGSDHIREKDGIWAILAWLSILAYRNQDESKPLVTVRDIVVEHWKKYGRNYYTRYDYEEVSESAGAAFKENMLSVTQSANEKKETHGDYKIALADDFSYNDPVDHSVSSNQGFRLLFTDHSRIIYRFSGTGSSGVTIRLYIEKYVSPTSSDVEQNPAEALDPLIKIALDVSKMKEITGRDAPTVIT
eukprot:TRINITY_DN11822_c0_g1_i1.p1 TRINITY_DN11822_c0_g1~~TRINITY_DN11822_c0_g1_i1.p1  ORF type:complete len:675 (+),score=191.41 TRINITY_DN11822_c0_g1_i1:46-2025(+)